MNINFKSPQFPLLLSVMAIGIVVVLFTTLAIQQNYRQSANDPQIQLAEDAAASMNQGNTPASPLPQDQVNMAASIAPFVIVTNAKLKVLSASGNLNGQTVLPPAGSFSDAKSGEHWFTWQPAAGVREAAVIVRFNNGYVVAARGLGPVEAREASLYDLAGLALLPVIVIPLAIFGITGRLVR
jgi:hypothetical protein